MVNTTVSTISLARCERFNIKTSLYSHYQAHDRGLTRHAAFFLILVVVSCSDIIADMGDGCTLLWTNRVFYLFFALNVWQHLPIDHL